MITSISIENFKGIGERITIPLRPITLLFGKNSAGKSTILHAMLLVHELLEHLNANPDRTTKGGTDLDLGGYKNFVHRGCEEEGVCIRFDFDMSATNWEHQFPVSEFLMNLGEQTIDVSDRGL